MAETIIPAEEPTPRRPRKAVISAVIGLIVAIQIGNWVAIAIFATLVKSHPAWLVFLSPTTRNLLLATIHMSAESFFILAIIRRTVPHPLWFFIGRWYGNSGIRWVEKYSPDTAAIVTAIEKYFPRWGWIICVIYPAPLVSVMAGASKMRTWAFMVYAIGNAVVFVWASRVFGDFLHPVTGAVANFSDDHKIAITCVTVLIVAYGIFAGQRGGKNKIESINTIEAELDGKSDK